MDTSPDNPVNEPFQADREPDRLLADFAIMLSCLPRGTDGLILDYGCGSGWLGEFLLRCGHRVIFFDFSQDAVRLAKQRVGLDSRLRSRTALFAQGAGQALPFASESLQSICCFDSLHHIARMEEGLKEMYRVLRPRGRAVFVEPGSKHSSAEATQEFVRKHKANDPDWIEQDVVLSWVRDISKTIGFSDLWVKPTLFPSMLLYNYETWSAFRQGEPLLRNRYCQQLATLNEESRVIFFLDKPNKLNFLPEDSTRAFIKTLYRTILFREPSEQEVLDWWVALTSGKVTQEQLHELFIASEERHSLERSIGELKT